MASATILCAAKRSHMIIPTCTVSSARRMSSVVDTNQLSDLQSKVRSMALEVELLRKDKQVLLRKHRDPFLKDIELEMSKVKSSLQDKNLPVNFKIVDDSSDSVTLERATHIPEQVIRLDISEPVSSGVPLRISVGSNGTFASQVRFYCTIRADGYKIDEIEAGKFCKFCTKKKMPFDLLPEIVKRRFYNYLEARGVCSRATGTIYRYMIQKQWGGFYKSFKKIAQAEA